MQSQDGHKLSSWVRRLSPTPVFPSQDGKPVEYYASYPLSGGVIDVHLLTLGRGLTYHTAVYSPPSDDGFMAIHVQGDPFKIAFNLSHHTLPTYVEGLPAFPYQPGEVHLLPLTRAASLVPPGTRAEMPCIFISRDFMDEIAADAGLPNGPRPASKPSRREPWQLSANIPEEVLLLLAMIEACPLRGGLRRLYVEGKVLEIISLVLAQMFATNEEQDDRPRLRPRDVRKAHEARDIVQSRLDDLPALSELARTVGMSTTALKKTYRAVFGAPIYEHARDERLKRARLLLVEGELSVGQVADMVGYRSMGYFSSAFRKKFGVLPREVWRRSH